MATCGTAFTEDHVRLLKRYASRVVLAFDADAAGQGAAERFYEWEQQYQVQVSVARLPGGARPGRAGPARPRRRWPRRSPTPRRSSPSACERVMDGRPARTPEDRARLAERAMGVVNEHPDANVRKLYAGQVASRGRAAGRRPRARRRAAHPPADARPSRRPGAPRSAENAEFVAVALLAQDWESIAGWLVEELFADEAHRGRSSPSPRPTAT